MNKRHAFRLGDLCSVITKGTTPTSAGFDFTTSGVPFLRAQNIRETIETDDLLFVAPQTHEALARSKIQNGDVLLTIAGTIGRVALVPAGMPEMNCNQAVAILRPKEGIEPRYLVHWLRSFDAKTQIFGSTVTATISNLSLGQISDMRLALPTVDEQRQDAGILETAEMLPQKSRRALMLLDRLTQSIFVDIFGEHLEGHRSVPLGKLVTEGRIGLVRSSADFGPNFSTPYVRMDAIGRTGRLNLGNVQKTEVTEKELNDFELRPGDFLFNTRNSRELVGKSAVFFGPAGMVYNNNILRLRFAPEVIPDYLVGYLQTATGRQALEERKAGTTSVFAIYQKSLDAMPLPVPPRDLQLRYASAMTAVRNQRELSETALAAAYKVFSSIQQRVFSSEAEHQ